MSTKPCINWCMECLNCFTTEAKYFEHLLGITDANRSNFQPQPMYSKRKQTFDVRTDDEESSPSTNNKRRRLVHSTPFTRSRRVSFTDEQKRIMNTPEALMDQMVIKTEPIELLDDRGLKTCDACGMRMKNVLLHQRRNRKCPAYSPVPASG